LLAQGYIVGCVRNFEVFSVFLASCRDCVVCTNDYVGLELLVLCLNALYEYTAAVCWLDVELCVLMFYIMSMYDVKYEVSEIKEYLIHLSILLLGAINTNIFKVVRTCLFELFVLFFILFYM
jgi:hypothetical protein